MAALALDAGILYARQLLQDSNANFPGASDTEYTRSINNRYMWMYKYLIKRTQVVTAITNASTTGLPVITGDAGFIYPEIEEAYIDPASGTDTPLERWRWDDLYAFVGFDGAVNSGWTVGTPELYAANRLHGSSEKWEFILWPIANDTMAMKARVRVMPTALSGSAVPELDDAQGYLLYQMAAYDIAPIIGRPELAEGILSSVPDNVRGMMVAEGKRMDPKRRPESSVLG